MNLLIIINKADLLIIINKVDLLTIINKPLFHKLIKIDKF